MVLLLSSELEMSLTMPSSMVPVLEDNGGEGVADRNDEAPDESTGDGKLG